VSFLEERASEAGKEDGGVVEDDGVSSGVSGEYLDEGTVSEVVVPLDGLVVRVAGTGAGTGWERFGGIIESR